MAPCCVTSAARTAASDTGGGAGACVTLTIGFAPGVIVTFFSIAGAGATTAGGCGGTVAGNDLSPNGTLRSGNRHVKA